MIKSIIRKVTSQLNFRHPINDNSPKKPAVDQVFDDNGLPLKAKDFVGRFREIISDPLNILIERDPRAGIQEGDYIYLHNGNKAVRSKEKSYYGNFSEILTINRGVHEPLEEFIFQEVLKKLPQQPTMIELGAYWGHYSMWLKKERKMARCFLVEGDAKNLEVGKHNFLINGYEGNFLQAFVNTGQFEIDRFVSENSIEHINILHSDIQGYEAEMLAGCYNCLKMRSVDYLFISTHSNQLHKAVSLILNDSGYNIEVDADFDTETTSCDGLIFASSPNVTKIFNPFFALKGRLDIVKSKPYDLLAYLQTSATACNSGY